MLSRFRTENKYKIVFVFAVLLLHISFHFQYGTPLQNHQVDSLKEAPTN